jgi:energy-coupling factor transport system permease protein
MAMSMETRAFGAFTQRTVVDAPRVGAGARLFSAAMLVLVIAWYAARALGYVHTIYVFTPG